MPDSAEVQADAAPHAAPADEAQLARVARNVTAIALSTLLARGLQFGWAILLARLLGEAGYGTWGVIAGMISTAAALPEFGMGLIVLRDVSRDPAKAGRYLSATLASQPPLALVAYLALIGISFLPGYDSAFRGLLAFAALSLFLDMLGNLVHNQLLAAEQMVTTSVILVTHIVLQIGLAALALGLGGGLPGLYAATLTAGAVRAALYWWALWRGGIVPHWPVDGRTVRILFRDGWPLALASFSGLAYQHLDKVLAFTLLTQADAGYLTSAHVIVFGVTELVGTTILTAVFPLMSRMAAENADALRALAERLFFLLFVILLPIAIGIALLAGRLSALLFPGFAGTALVLEIVIWQVIASLPTSVLGQEMIMRRQQVLMVALRLVGLGVNVLLNLLLMPRIGVQGAGIAIVASWISLLVMFLAARRTSAAALRQLLGAILRAVLAGLVMISIIVAVRDSNAILAGTLGGLGYIGGLVFFRALGPDEWRLLRRLAGSLPVIGPRLTARFPV